MNRSERRQRQRITRQLQQAIANNGIELMLSRLFGATEWRYDEQEKLWIVPDSKYRGAGREFYCVRADGSWFKARLDQEHTQ